MATIHVNRAGTSLGTFSEEDVRAGLESGRFQPSDLGWKEGMASWQPLSQFAEFAGVQRTAAPPPTATTPPAPSAIAPVGTDPAVGTAAPPRSGLPWEHRDTLGFPKAFLETLSMVLTKPSLAFSVMRTEGGLVGPLLYAVIGAGIGVIIWFILSLGLTSLGTLGNRDDALGSMFGMTASGIVFVWRLIMIVIVPFVAGGIEHLALMMLGAAKKPFETSFRVAAFSLGSVGPLVLVPCCGGLAAIIWFLVANCIGLSRAHEIDTGKATLAVFLPLVICCGGLAVLLILFFGGIGALMQHANH